MSPLPPRATRTDTLLPCTTLFRSRVTTRDRAVTLARVVSRPVAALCLLVLVVQVALMVWLARSSAIGQPNDVPVGRSEAHTSELQSIMRNSYDGFCLKKKLLTLIVWS